MINIPPPVRRFVTDHVPTLERLEILLLLFQARNKAWRVDEIEEQLRTTPESIQRHLSTLAQQGLVARTDDGIAAYVYAAEGERDDAVKKLAAVYRTRRVTTIELIYSQQRTER